jgi:hypothetical protein
MRNPKKLMNTARSICRLLLFCGIQYKQDEPIDKSVLQNNPLIHPFPNPAALVELFNGLVNSYHIAKTPKIIKPNTTVTTPETQVLDTVACVASLLRHVNELDNLCLTLSPNGVPCTDVASTAALQLMLNTVFNLTTDVLLHAASYKLGHRIACLDRLKYGDITVTLPCHTDGALRPYPVSVLCVPGVIDTIGTHSSHILSCIRLRENKVSPTFYQLIGDLGADSQSILSFTRLFAIVTFVRLRWFPDTVSPGRSVFVRRFIGKCYEPVLKPMARKRSLPGTTTSTNSARYASAFEAGHAGEFYCQNGNPTSRQESAASDHCEVTARQYAARMKSGLHENNTDSLLLKETKGSHSILGNGIFMQQLHCPDKSLLRSLHKEDPDVDTLLYGDEAAALFRELKPYLELADELQRAVEAGATDYALLRRCLGRTGENGLQILIPPLIGVNLTKFCPSRITKTGFDTVESRCRLWAETHSLLQQQYIGNPKYNAIHQLYQARFNRVLALDLSAIDAMPMSYFHLAYSHSASDLKALIRILTQNINDPAVWEKGGL